MKSPRILISILPILLSVAYAKETTSAKLQILNRSTEKVSILWLDGQGQEVPRGSIAPKDHTVLDTSLGHRFVIIGETSKKRTEIKSKVLVQAYRHAPQDKDNIPNFYTQRVKAGGLPIVASASVNPYALKEAAYIVDKMLSKRADIREAMIKSGVRVCILGNNEYTTDLPDFSHFANFKSPEPSISAKNFWDKRARGTGGSSQDPYCSCGEENLLGYPGDPYEKENILIHEFAHSIHIRGLSNVDPTFDDRLEKAYQKSIAKGLWKNKYGGSNRFEYFAEGVQSWFNNNRENDHDHNHVNTRKELIEYDPVLAAFCKEIFRDTEFNYTKPSTRLNDHMEGYNPSKAPTFKWPERLSKANEAIRKSSRETD